MIVYGDLTFANISLPNPSRLQLDDSISIQHLKRIDLALKAHGISLQDFHLNSSSCATQLSCPGVVRNTSRDSVFLPAFYEQSWNPHEYPGDGSEVTRYGATWCMGAMSCPETQQSPRPFVVVHVMEKRVQSAGTHFRPHWHLAYYYTERLWRVRYVLNTSAEDRI